MDLRLEERNGNVSIWQGELLLLHYRGHTLASKPHCDVVALPAGAGETAGTNLVLCSPHDHVWHFGLFYVPKLVDGINCWESELFRQDGRVHGYAQSRGLRLEGEGRKAEGVALSDTIVWRSSEGEELVREHRRIDLAAPRGAAYTLTWETRLEALGQNRHLSSESRHGHYSGLSVRFIRSMTNGRVLLPAVENPPADSGPAGPWCDYSGYLDGSLLLGKPHAAGIALFDHPANRYAARFFTMNQPFGFISANPTYYQVLTLRRGEPVTFRWGLWVHAGRPEAAAVQAAYDEWTERPG